MVQSILTPYRVTSAPARCPSVTSSRNRLQLKNQARTVRKFSNLIVSAVKIYKQYLQTASASGGVPRTLTRASPLDTLEDFRPSACVVVSPALDALGITVQLQIRVNRYTERLQLGCKCNLLPVVWKDYVVITFSSSNRLNCFALAHGH